MVIQGFEETEDLRNLNLPELPENPEKWDFQD